MLLRWLKIVRVHTKVPGQRADLTRPYTVFEGQTVGDICSLVRRDFVQNLRFARLWRKADAPVTVSKSEPVSDGDIVELHI
ncbi:MAG TPA: TGS domain-containing protein [Spirochaetia bacterium]|nr:TGS domain-containing protein [Spirochaetia bacterium]